jgi:hypothetical protein
MSASWRSKVTECFLPGDFLFAAHPSQEERAFILLATLRREIVGWREVHDAFRTHLAAYAPAVCIDEQLERIEERYRPWLLG